MNEDVIRDNHKESMTTHIRTSFIFPLAEIERIFGFLWGEEVEDKNQLTPEQYKWYKVYKQLRKSILDNGNNQIRFTEQEINKLYISNIKCIMKPWKED